MAIQQTFQPCVVLAIVAIGLSATFTFAQSDVDSSQDFLPSEDIFVARGHSIRLDCDVDEFWHGASLPPPSSSSSTLAANIEVEWLLDGEPLSPDDARYKIYKNGTLVVSKFGKRLNNGSQGGSTAMEGSYQCLLKNQRYGTLLTKTINLRIAYLKEFLQQPEDLQVYEGQAIIIPCSINSLPKATVHWERDGVALPQDKKYVPLPSGSLLVTHVHSSDVGSYRCKVVNSILKKTRKSKAGYLSINSSQDDDNNALSTRIIPLDIQSNISALAGTDVTLYCVVDGVTSTLRWMNNHDVVVSNNSIFTLRNITRDQGGQYTCSVSNPNGVTAQKKVYFVNVLQIPMFNSTPSAGVHALARTIRLNCTASGWPPPKIRWLKNGRPFDELWHIRAKFFDWGLLISSPTVSDSGIYQCVAHNSVGAILAGASVRLNTSTNSPSEPRDIQCLPYKEDNVCLRWKGEANVQAFTIYVYKKGSNLKDYLTNDSFILADKLEPNTKYMFLIRAYRTKASTEFANVNCTTGVRGFRNFTAQLQSSTVMLLNWQHVSTDYNPCAERTNQNYLLQWRKLTSQGLNSIDVVGFEATVEGLIPGEIYEFRVLPKNKNSPADILQYSIPHPTDKNQNFSQGEENNVDSVLVTNDTTLLSPPSQLEAIIVSTNSINVSWNDNNTPNTVYTLCYIQQNKHQSCEVNGKLIKRFSGKSILLEGLKPKTDYEIRIRAHFDDQVTAFSHSLLITTPSDVPSKVQGLEYKVLTRTSACVKWEPPLQSNGRIHKYSIRHTANASLPFDEWIASSIFIPMNSDGCWDDMDTEKIVVSTVLHDLDPDLLYYVNVAAVNDVGTGAASVSLSISTKYPFHRGLEDQDDDDVDDDSSNIYYRQGMGVALGIVIAFLSIFACVGVYFVCRYIRKRRLLRRRFVPNGSTYSSTTTRPKAINGQPCRNDVHELQQLVETNGHSHIPSMPATILDSKGSSEYPNGIHTNNIHNKTGYLNGHATNLRITENPQYYKKADIKSIDEVSALNSVGREYEEDSNSNLQKVCPVTKALCYGRDVQLNGKSDANSTLNSTQTTVLLDDSISSTSSPRQPTLEPNG